jgi:hypothetical protein
MAVLTAIRRPDGRLYQPRKVIAWPLAGDDEVTSGVMVLGTHDIERARKLADEALADWTDGGCTAAGPETGWFREGYESGRRVWVRDNVRGRAGVLFRRLAESGN